MTTTRKLNRRRKKSKTRKRRVMKGGSIYYEQNNKWQMGKDINGNRNNPGKAYVNKYSAFFFNEVMPLLFDFTPNNCDDFVNFFVGRNNIIETQITGNNADGLAKASSEENIKTNWRPLIKERVGEYITEIKEQKDIIEKYKKTIRGVKIQIQNQTNLTVIELGEYPDRKLIKLYNSIEDLDEDEKIEFNELSEKRKTAIDKILNKLNILLILDQNIKKQIESRTKAIEYWEIRKNQPTIKMRHVNYKKAIKTIDDDISSQIRVEMSYIIDHIFKYNIHEFWNTFKNNAKDLEMGKVGEEEDADNDDENDDDDDDNDDDDDDNDDDDDDDGNGDDDNDDDDDDDGNGETKGNNSDDDDDDDGNDDDDDDDDGKNNALRDYYLFILENKKMKDLKRELMEIINKEETEEENKGENKGETEEKINQITNNINESINSSYEYYNNFINYIILKAKEKKKQSVESISNNRNGWNNIKKMLKAAFVRKFQNIVLSELNFDDTAGQATMKDFYEQKQRKLESKQAQEQKQKKEREDAEKLEKLRKQGTGSRLKMITAFALPTNNTSLSQLKPPSQQQTCPQGWETQTGHDNFCFKWYNHPNVADSNQTRAAELIKEHLRQKYSINPIDVKITTGQSQCKPGFKIGINNLKNDIMGLSEEITKILEENRIPVLERQFKKKDNACQNLINLFFPREKNDETSIGKLLKKIAKKKKNINIFLQNQNVGKCKLTDLEIDNFIKILNRLNETYNPTGETKGETKSDKGTELLSHLSENDKTIFLKVKAIVDFVSYYPQGLQGGNKKRKIKTKKRKIFRQRKKKPKTRKIDRYKKTIKTK